MRRTRKRTGAAVAAIAVLALAGCGGSDEKSSDTTVQRASKQIKSSASGSSAEQTERARTAGEAAGEKAGGKQLPESVTVGYLQVAGGLEATERSQAATAEAAKVLGWKLRVCDAQGDPAKMNSCGMSLLNQGADTIVMLTIEPAVIGQVLKAAQRKQVPVFNMGAEVTPSPLLAGNYGPDDRHNGELLGKHVAEQLQGEIDPMLGVSFAAHYGKARDEGFLAGLKQGGVADPKFAELTVLEQADLIGSARQQTSTMLTKHPDAKLIYNMYEASMPGQQQAIDAKFAGKSYPDRPFVATFDGHLEILDQVRRNKIQAVGDANFDASGWIAIDSAAQMLAGGDPHPTPANEVDGFPIYSYSIVTPENVPPKGEYVKIQNDFVTFFRSKWEKEFGVR